MIYQLPSHPSRRCSDPLSLTDIENPSVWEVIEAAIRSFRSGDGLAVKTLDSFPEFLDTLSYSIHGKGAGNCQLLVRVLKKEYGALESSRLLGKILDLALRLPSAFNSHSFHHLSAENPQITLTGSQLRVLVAHQFLGTLTPSPGNTWGCNLVQWYSEPQALHQAIRGYILTMLRFLDGPEPTPVTCELFTSKGTRRVPIEDKWAKCDANVFDHLMIETISARTVQFPHKRLKAHLVAANKEPGFGCSCTQEELVTAACPALLPLGAILFTPPIPDDGVLVVRGATPLSRWEGQGRDAHMTEPLTSPTAELLLLMDAIEFDIQQCDNPTPDLIPGNLVRELTKAYTGFQSLLEYGYSEIAAPLWGAGAFNGNPVIKTMILAMAGAKAGIRVYISIDEERKHVLPSGEERNLAQMLEELKRRLSEKSVREIWDILIAPEAPHYLFE